MFHNFSEDRFLSERTFIHDCFQDISIEFVNIKSVFFISIHPKESTSNRIQKYMKHPEIYVFHK